MISFTCFKAILRKDGDTLDRTAGAIRGRSLRVCDVVEQDMQMHEPGPYSDKVKNAVRVLRNQGGAVRKIQENVLFI